MINKDLHLFILPYLSMDSEISERTELLKDLHLVGDRAKTFLADYSEKFNVDISNFDFEKYFSGNPHLANKRKQALNIGDLERAIALGVLDEHTIYIEENDLNLPPTYSTKTIVLGILLCIVLAAVLGLVAYLA